MSKAKSATQPKVVLVGKAPKPVQEIPVPEGWVLVKRGPTKHVKVRPEDQASSLLPKVARALGKPGIQRSSIFGDASNKKVFAYSVYAKDPTKFVREAADGTQTIGVVVNGKFKALASS